MGLKLGWFQMGQCAICEPQNPKENLVKILTFELKLPVGDVIAWVS
jgi:hypothetical protein